MYDDQQLYPPKKGTDSVFGVPFDVKLLDQPLTIVYPDIIVICDKNKLYGQHNGALDFIIVIIFPDNPTDDYIRKLYYYKSHSIYEYWIVDPSRKAIT